MLTVNYKLNQSNRFTWFHIKNPSNFDTSNILPTTYQFFEESFDELVNDAGAKPADLDTQDIIRNMPLIAVLELSTYSTRTQYEMASGGYRNREAILISLGRETDDGGGYTNIPPEQKQLGMLGNDDSNTKVVYVIPSEVEYVPPSPLLRWKPTAGSFQGLLALTSSRDEYRV